MSSLHLARAIRAGLLLGCLLQVSGCFDASGDARAAIPGDGHNHGTPAQGGHVHEDVVIPVTLWDQGIELFLEYPAPVAGEPTEFITHVSRIDTGEPRRQGPVTFRLTPAEGAAIEHVEAEPARDGIYLPVLVFPIAGTWTVSLEIPGEEGVVKFALPATTVYATEHDAQHASPPEVPEGVSFLKEQQWRLGTLTGLVESCTLTEMIRVPGHVKVLPGRSAKVTPPVAGVLMAPEGGALPQLGQDVEAGELLALVRPPFTDALVRVQAARADVARTKVALEREQMVLERTQALFDQNARSQRELDEATFAVRLAEADARSAVTVLESLETSGLIPNDAMQFELRAPIGGHAHHIDATIGEQVEPGDPILDILDPSRVLIEARPRIDQLQRVSDLESPSFVHLRGALGKDAPLDTGAVHLLTSGDEVDPRTRTVALSYDVANPDLTLRIGQALDVLLPAGTGDCLAVPVDALVDEGGETTVYLQVGGETFERRPVLTGLRSGSMVEILSGLEPGERVVVRGAYAIRLQSAAGSVPAHHHH